MGCQIVMLVITELCTRCACREGEKWARVCRRISAYGVVYEGGWKNRLNTTYAWLFVGFRCFSGEEGWRVTDLGIASLNPGKIFRIMLPAREGEKWARVCRRISAYGVVYEGGWKNRLNTTYACCLLVLRLSSGEDGWWVTGLGIASLVGCQIVKLVITAREGELVV